MVLAELNSNSDVYKLVLLLHILSVIVGLGSVMLNGIYGVQAKNNPGPGGLAILKANHKVSSVAEKVIYLIPIFGLGLVGMSNKEWQFSQTWVWLALTLYVIALGIAHAVLIPGAKKLISLAEEMSAGGPPKGDGPPPQVAQMQGIGKRMAMGGMTNNLLIVILLYLMIFKPGT